MAVEPVHTIVAARFDEPEKMAWDDVRILGYYDGRDFVYDLVEDPCGRRYQLPDGRLVDVTRQWANLDPPLNMLSKWHMALHLLDEKPAADTFVADISNAMLVAVYDKHELEPSWREARTRDALSTPLARLRHLFATHMAAPVQPVVPVDTPVSPVVARAARTKRPREATRRSARIATQRRRE